MAVLKGTYVNMECLHQPLAYPRLLFGPDDGEENLGEIKGAHYTDLISAVYMSLILKITHSVSSEEGK